MKNGLFEENGELIYYKDDSPYHAGVIKVQGDIYYIGRDGKAVTGRHTVHSSMTNGILKHGRYRFGEDGKLVKTQKSKNGLFHEDGSLVYYRHGRPYHAGVIKDGEDIYYIAEKGRAVKGQHEVHSEMSNDILKHGTYTFGEDYKLIPDSYIPLKKKKWYSVKSLFKSKIMDSILVIVALGLVIDAVYTFKSMDRNQVPTASGTSSEETGEAQTVLPNFEEEVLLCSSAAKRVYDGEISVKQALSGGNPYRPFVFEYRLPEQDGTLSISEYSDMRAAKKVILSSKEQSVSIDNLKTGTTYYYTVTVGKKSYPGSFKTAESTRFVKMPGVKNTRDIGGYTTLDGKKVKQGMLIRGTEIDGLVEPSYFLEQDYVDYVKDTFGFACDLDLRESSLLSGNYQTRLGKNVAHKFYNSPMYGSIFSADYQPALRKIFADLADPTNYPMYLHCTYGADRTGTICFLLEGVLNLPEDVMQRDYQMTGYFSSGYASSTSFNSIYGGTEGYSGDTIQKRIVSYLTSSKVGVTQKQIQSIRNILLEK